MAMTVAERPIIDEPLEHELDPEVQTALMAHAGEWVALTRSEIIAFGSDVRQVAQAAADAGVESPIIYRVPAEEATFYERKPRRGRRFPLARVQASARALGTRRRRRSA